jgi:hypothetical protein
LLKLSNASVDSVRKISPLVFATIHLSASLEALGFKVKTADLDKMCPAPVGSSNLEQLVPVTTFGDLVGYIGTVIFTLKVERENCVLQVELHYILDSKGIPIFQAACCSEGRPAIDSELEDVIGITRQHSSKLHSEVPIIVTPILGATLKKLHGQ